MVRLWEKEGSWAVVRGTAIKSLGAMNGIVRRLSRQKSNTQGEPALSPHARWMASHMPGAEELARQRHAAQSFDLQPLISLICPVYNPPAGVLNAAIRSVLDQTYGNWQLCLVDGGSAPDIRAELAGFAQQDSRIQARFLEANLGIAGNSNQALEMARGEFVALFDHDDMLAPNMLYEVVALLNARPEADIIYFDEDHLAADGSPGEWSFFKPDWWSPEMLLSTNYLMHSVIRRALVEEAGGFDPAFDGAQDWDLLFRCTERTHRVYHIPKILYHWRQSAASASREAFIAERQARCVEAHLRRIGLPQPQAQFLRPGILRVTWPIQARKISIIIPTKDNLKYLRRCLDSILQKTAYPQYEIIVMDTGSRQKQTLQYYQTLKTDTRIHIIEYTRPFNYSAVNNAGVCYADGDLLLFLNNDVEAIESDWLEEMARWAEQPEIGAVGAKLLYRDGSVQHAGVTLGMQGFASHIFWDAEEDACSSYGCVDWYRDYMAVTGACLMMRREVFQEMNGFDESYLLAFSDVEICLRIVASGYRVVYTPFARLYHYEGRTRADHIPKNDLEVAYKHMRDYVEAGDPYFNPNLSYFSRMPVTAPLGEETRIHYLERMMRFYGVLKDAPQARAH